MAMQESRRKVVPSLYDALFRSEFDRIERMLAPGALWEIFPASTRPFFAPPLPREGVFDARETLDYFKTIREKLLTDPKVRAPLYRRSPLLPLTISLPALRVDRPQSGHRLAHGALQYAVVVVGHDGQQGGRQPAVRHLAHALRRVRAWLGQGEARRRVPRQQYVSFPFCSPEIARAWQHVLTLSATRSSPFADSLNVHMKRDATKPEWEDVPSQAQRQVEGQQQQKQQHVEATSADQQTAAPAAGHQSQQAQKQQPAASQSEQQEKA